MPTTIIIILVIIIIVAIGCISFARGMSHNGGDNLDDDVDPDEILARQEAAEELLYSTPSSQESDTVTEIDFDEDRISDMLAEIPDLSELEEMLPDDYSHNTPVSAADESDTSFPEGLTAADISSRSDAEGADIWADSTYDKDIPGYDIFRNGNFYITGYSISDGKSEPLELIISSGKVYMSSSLDGIKVGLLVDENKKVFMISQEKSAYLEVSEGIMRSMGVSADEMATFNADIANDYLSLEDASSVRECVLHGHNCTEYTFDRDGGECAKVYTDGKRLLRFATFAKYGILKAATDVVTITDDIPSEKLVPPQEFKRYSGVVGLAKFMLLFAPGKT